MELPVRVLIVDDHQVLREGLAGLLTEEDDLDVVGQAATSADAVAAAGALAPDVVLLDHRLPDGDAIGTAAELQRVSPGSKIVIFTASDDRRLIADAAAAGCAGYLNKATAGDEIIAALRAVARGEPWDWVGFDDVADVLSARERRVLELTAEGRDNRSIAAEMFLSVNTVRNHQQRILSKLEVHSKLEAVAAGVRMGLVSLESPRS